MMNSNIKPTNFFFFFFSNFQSSSFSLKILPPASVTKLQGNKSDALTPPAKKSSISGPSPQAGIKGQFDFGNLFSYMLIVFVLFMYFMSNCLFQMFLFFLICFIFVILVVVLFCFLVHIVDVALLFFYFFFSFFCY